ncbi:MAG: hypothetical protein AB7O97_00715 [Planctomycetota bacterium]
MEKVFVVARADFFGGAWPQGYVGTGAGTPSLAEFGEAGFFVDRAPAEDEPAWKQLIPYCMVRRGGEVLTVQRSKGQTEQRLHDRMSIGIGGHVNPQPEAVPADGAAFFTSALWQELEEELSWPLARPVEPQLLGLLNDDGEAVGRVHAGLVFAVDLPVGTPDEQVPYVRETTKMRGGFRHLADLQTLWQDPCRFESWSRILFRACLFRTGIAKDSSAGHRAAPPVGRSIPAHPRSTERNSTHG